MLFEEREFLKTLYGLVLDAISERRVFIDEFVSVSVPPDHPLQQMRVLLTNRLKSKKALSSDTDKKIQMAAKLRSEGEKWRAVDELYGESFRKDLSKGKRYHLRYLEWLSAFEFLKEGEDRGQNPH